MNGPPTSREPSTVCRIVRLLQRLGLGFLCGALALPCLAQSRLTDPLAGGMPVSEFDLPETDADLEGGPAFRAYPMAVYLPGTGLVAAGYLQQKGLLTEDDKLEFYGATTFGDERAFVLNYSDPEILGTPFKLKAWASYANFDKKYFGRGNDTRSEDAEKFLPGTLEYGVSLSRELGGPFTIEAAILNRSWDLRLLEEPSSIPLEDQAGGLTRSLRVDLERDTRDDRLEPSRGGRDLLRVELSAPALGSDFDYSRLDLRLARYRPISGRQVLALRAEFATILSGEAPFFELPRLGGSTRLRGASGGRYQANSSLLFGAEWRVRITQPLSLALFTEAGKVWDNSDRVSLEDFHVTGGIGARYRLGSGFLLRFDVGVSGGGVKPIGAFDQAF